MSLLMMTILSGFQAWSDEGNISPTDKFVWSETVGWINLRPTDGGVTVHENGANGFLSCFAWAENIGWIKMGSGSGPYANTSSSNWGVNLDAADSLSGYAWSETMGWINFNPTHSQVTTNTGSGEFDNYAWSENFGFLHFRNTSPMYGAIRSFNLSPATVPTLTEWGIIVLVLGLAGAASPWV